MFNLFCLCSGEEYLTKVELSHYLGLLKPKPLLSKTKFGITGRNSLHKKLSAWLDVLSTQFRNKGTVWNRMYGENFVKPVHGLYAHVLP